ncbi:hypothetical protein BGX24_008256 [Mortierella sp. AD032]|nr:hypothetical protein BGX24_008256 [Mortierella sp. AD032]
MNIFTRATRLKARLGFSAFLALALTTTLVQAQQQLCSTQLCITATVFSKESTIIEFSLSAQIDSIGWVGMGIGGQAGGMAGNDLAICWPNSAGGAVISQRAAIRNGTPSAPAATPAFKVQAPKSGLVASRFTCTFSRPLNLATSPIAATATSVDIIYAVGLRPVVPGAGGDPQKATLQAHSFVGTGTLTIVKKEGTSAGNKGDGGNATKTGTVPGATHTPGVGGNNGGTSPSTEELLRAQDQIETLVKVHAVMMALAFLLIFPLGASLVRFFCHLQHVFKWHRPIQATGFLTVITAFGCILAAIAKSSSLNNNAPIVYSTHAKYDPTKTRQSAVVRIPTWVHRCWGYAVLITGLVQVYLGMKQYGMWPTGKEVIWYLYYVWVAVLVAGVFVLGSILKCVGDRRKDGRRGVVDGDRPLKSSGVSDDYLGAAYNSNNNSHHNTHHQGPYELRPHGVHSSNDNEYNRL